MLVVVLLFGVLFITGCGETTGSVIGNGLTREEIVKCEGYESNTFRDRCYMVLAVSRANKAICDRIRDFETRATCRDSVETYRQLEERFNDNLEKNE